MDKKTKERIVSWWITGIFVLAFAPFIIMAQWSLFGWLFQFLPVELDIFPFAFATIVSFYYFINYLPSNGLDDPMIKKESKK